MVGYTRIHRNDDYETHENYFGAEPEQINGFED
jgi:hypothetical protein